jgi:plasmid replication initiation protein|tara:strand:- start:4694 stop:5737 length:1044 start_codon:yes stop_codon:yes gene_type:complete
MNCILALNALRKFTMSKKTKELVVKDNALIEASHSLNLVPQRLIVLAIIEAREQGTMIKAGGILKIKASDYVKTFNVGTKSGAAYQALKSAADELLGATFKWRSKDENGKQEINVSQFVQRVTYVEDAAHIKIMFSHDIMPLITRLDKRYTEYDLIQISDLKSIYSLRVFEMFMQWIGNRNPPAIKLEDFRERLGLADNQYETMSDFKKRVLNPSLAEINLKTNIEASYEQEKEGVKIVGFRLISKYKKPIKNKVIDAKKEVKSEEKTQISKKIPPLSDAQIETFGDKLYKNFDFMRDVIAQQQIFMGKSESECKLIVKQLLSDENKVEEWKKHMIAVGYRFPEKQN